MSGSDVSVSLCLGVMVPRHLGWPLYVLVPRSLGASVSMCLGVLVSWYLDAPLTSVLSIVASILVS